MLYQTVPFLLLLFFMNVLPIRAEEVAEENKIILVKNAKRITDQEAREAAAADSEMNADSGYNANEKLLDCFAEMEYRYTGGRYVDEPIRFRFLTPTKIEPNKKYPLILWLHGAGESGDNNRRQLSHAQYTIEFFSGPKKLDFFMLVTQCPADNRDWNNSVSGDGKGDAPITIANEILDAVVKEYPIDTDKLGVFGICSGGNAVWTYVRNHPEKFAAMAVCSSTVSGDATVFKDTAIWAFNNKNDTVPYQEVERFIQSINVDGGNAYLTLRADGGHDSWKRALRDYKVVQWMLLQEKNVGGPPQEKIYRLHTSQACVKMFALPIVIIIASAVIIRRRNAMRNHRPRNYP